MKVVFACVASLLLFSAPLSVAQDAAIAWQREYNERNQNLAQESFEGGSHARTLRDLVVSSPVIVRGRWGALLSRGVDYGYGVTKEEVMARVGATEATIHMFGLPNARYTLEIDEILKGAERLDDATSLTLVVGESPEVPDIINGEVEFREGEHLFFLYHTIDNDAYFLRGAMFDMKLVANTYQYHERKSWGSASDPPTYLSAFGSENPAEFIAAINALAAE